MPKQYMDITIWLEHPTKPTIQKRFQTKGLGAMKMAGSIANLYRQGYKITKANGDPEDPTFQALCGERKDFYNVAAESTGADLQKIKDKVDHQIDSWKKRFKGMIPDGQ